jgi:hypothetical protein
VGLESLTRCHRARNRDAAICEVDDSRIPLPPLRPPGRRAHPWCYRRRELVPFLTWQRSHVSVHSGLKALPIHTAFDLSQVACPSAGHLIRGLRTGNSVERPYSPFSATPTVSSVASAASTAASVASARASPPSMMSAPASTKSGPGMNGAAPWRMVGDDAEAAVPAWRAAQPACAAVSLACAWSVCSSPRRIAEADRGIASVIVAWAVDGLVGVDAELLAGDRVLPANLNVDEAASGVGVLAGVEEVGAGATAVITVLRPIDSSRDPGYAARPTRALGGAGKPAGCTSLRPRLAPGRERRLPVCPVIGGILRAGWPGYSTQERELLEVTAVLVVWQEPTRRRIMQLVLKRRERPSNHVPVITSVDEYEHSVLVA